MSDREFIKENLVKRQGPMRTVIIVFGAVVLFGLILGIDVLLKG